MTYDALPPQELFESLGPIGIIATLRQREQLAARLQERQVDSHAEADQPLQTSNYLIFSEIITGRHIPSKHNRVVFIPQKDKEPVADIAQVNVRYPVTSDNLYEELAPEHSWNDIFLEVWNSRGESQDYLLNSNGLQAFDQIEDVVPDEEFAHTGNIYRVQNLALVRVPVNIETLGEIFPPNFLDERPKPGYVYAHQTTDLEQPYIP